MDDLEKYRKIGQDFIDNLKLLTYPIAVKLVKPGDYSHLKRTSKKNQKATAN